jgi:4-hydroxy-3-methylbut-2-enyl diphosphate reductase
LVEVCRQAGVPAHLVDDHGDVNPAWLENVSTVAVTAGASAPEHLVQELLDYLRDAHAFHQIEEVELKEEDVRFSLPSGLDASPLQLTTIASARV